MRRAAIALVTTITALLAGLPASAQNGNPTLGLGFGYLRVDEGEASGSETHQYMTANLRFRLGQQRARGLTRFIEGEVGYWDSAGHDDLLLGANFIGVRDFERLGVFFGGGLGVHFIGADTPVGSTVDSSDTAPGINAQLGVDVRLGRKTVFFTAARLDYTDSDELDELQPKAYLGVRFGFGD